MSVTIIHLKISTYIKVLFSVRVKDFFSLTLFRVLSGCRTQWQMSCLFNRDWVEHQKFILFTRNPRQLIKSCPSVMVKIRFTPCADLREGSPCRRRLRVYRDHSLRPTLNQESPASFFTPHSQGGGWGTA